MSKTKIVVFKLKELLLTAALVVFGILILLLVVQDLCFYTQTEIRQVC